MSENKKIVVGGGNTSPSETTKMGFSPEEIAAMKAAGAASGQDTSVIDELPLESSTPNIPSEFIDDEFEIPTEIVDLPSGGKFYPGGQSQVKIKYLTAEAEDIIFSPELINSGRVLDVLLEHGIADSYGLKPEEMLVADRNAIIIELRKTGFGEEYSMGDVTCPSCGEKDSPEVSLDLIEYKGASEAPDINGEFSVVLPVTKKNIKFRLLNGADEKILSKSSSQKGKGKIKYNKLITQRYIRQITEIDGNRDKTYINKFIGFMPLKDSVFLREYIKRVDPGFDFNATVECPHCGTVHDKEVTLNPVNLFYPDAEF
jgi:hypothetical protein